MLRLGFFVALSLAGPASLTQAEDGEPVATKGSLPATLTGKERLVPKWTDEQRIDNCNVPLDKRGTRPRPSICTNAPPS